MCLLTYYPPTVQPITEELSNGAKLNDDGHGWAIVTEDGILSERYFLASLAIESFVDARKANPDGAALFHSRMATDGALAADNIHPFTVSGDKRTVLAHNGILPLRPRKGDRRSDTRLLADSVGGMFGSLRKAKTRTKIEAWMGAYNKIVILTANPRYDSQAYILNESAGAWTNDGIWYSNEGYQGFRYYGGGYTEYADGTYTISEGGSYVEHWPSEIGTPAGTKHADKRWWDELNECKFCLSIMSGAEASLGWCENCDTCQDCAQTSETCQCFVPASAKQAAADYQPKALMSSWRAQDQATVSRWQAEDLGADDAPTALL